MRSRKRLSPTCRLYLILDTQVADYTKLFEIAKQAVQHGIDILQLRDKNGTVKDIMQFSRKILTLTKKRIPYILNDRVDLAMACGASGVHLGQDDIPVDKARKIMGAKYIIGASCQSLSHARQAQSLGADYIGFGSVFKTQTKPQRHPMELSLLTKVVRQINIPVFAIGGITFGNCSAVLTAGVKRVAVCRDVCLANNAGLAVKNLQLKLNTLNHQGHAKD